MIVNIDHLMSTPIMSLQTGSELARISGVIVDPRTLTISAFYVDSPLLSSKPSVLHPVDIREYSEIGMIVDGDDRLMSLEGLVRLNEVISFGFELTGLKVIDEDGRKCGKVVNYSVDTTSWNIQQVHTGQAIFRSLRSVGSIIHRNQIVSVNNQELIIKSTKISVEEDAPSPISQAFVNPFRSNELPEG